MRKHLVKINLFSITIYSGGDHLRPLQTQTGTSSDRFSYKALFHVQEAASKIHLSPV